jgi:hypothetical protein
LVTIAVEGMSDRPVARNLLTTVGLEIGKVYDNGGKSRLDRRLTGFNNAAQFAPWFVLRDMDHDAPCPGELVTQKLVRPAPLMCFRVAVRETEAWLLADREQIATWLSIPLERVPVDPDLLPDPKQALINLARHSRSRALREDLVPADGTTAQVGPGYIGRISEYAQTLWRPETGAANSGSLQRCLVALKVLAERIAATSGPTSGSGTGST